MAQPSLSPIAVTPLVCVECSQQLRPEIVSMGRGAKPNKLDKIVYFCDGCQYGYEVTKQHVVGTNFPYAAPKPAEPKRAIPMNKESQVKLPVQPPAGTEHV